MINFQENGQTNRPRNKTTSPNKSMLDNTRMYKCYKLFEKQYDPKKNQNDAHTSKTLINTHTHTS